MVIRVAKVVRLRAAKADQYVELHRVPWPGVLDALTRHDVRNYSIFLHHGVLFSYFEYWGHDYEADMDAIAADPESQRWLAQFSDTFVPADGAAPGELRTVLTEIFHLD